MKKTRKGFTIVELIIVIAVIAVLTAILVPTFIHLTKKANEAADHSLVTNLNKALAMREAEKGEKGKNNTMHDVVLVLDDAGYKLPNLVLKSEDKLLWNQKTNRFVLESDDKGDYADIDFWRIQESLEENQTYSVYAGLNFPANPVTVAVGFDAGYHTDISEVSYVRTSGAAQTVTIRTNGYDSKLVVNAPADTVHHYDYLSDLTVTAVDPSNSYHEHGVVKGKASISAGHFVVEPGAEVPYVSVESATSAVKVTTNESTIITVDDGSASNTSVVANSEGVYVSGDVSSVTGTSSADVVRSQLITTWAQLVALEDAEDAFAKLGANITDAQMLSIASGHTFKLDLNGHSLETIESATARHYYAMDNYGETVVFDSSNDGAGQIKARGLQNDGGKLTILSGKFYNVDGNGGAAVWNEADLTINGGSFIVEYVGSSKDSYGPGVINSQPGSKLAINNGTFTSASMRTYTIIADGETLINNCTVTGAHGALSIDCGEATINGGSFTCTEYYGCWITNDGADTKVTINGGSFSGSYGLYSSVDDGHQDESNVAIVINGGSFTGQSGKAAIINAKHSQYRFALSVYGGTFNSDPTEYLAQGHTASQKDGIWTVK